MEAIVLESSFYEDDGFGEGYVLEIEILTKKFGVIRGSVSSLDNTKDYPVGSKINVEFLENGDPYNFYKIV